MKKFDHALFYGIHGALIVVTAVFDLRQVNGIRTISAALTSRVSTRSDGAPRIVPIFTPALSTEAISGNSFPGAAT